MCHFDNFIWVLWNIFNIYDPMYYKAHITLYSAKI